MPQTIWRKTWRRLNITSNITNIPIYRYTNNVRRIIMVFKRSYTDEQFLYAVKNSKFMTEAIRMLGLAPGNHKIFKKVLEKLNPDISHWIDPHVLRLSNLKKEEIPLEEILIENSKYLSTTTLKERLIRSNMLLYECCICGINSWNGSGLVLQLDHINGVRTDNRIENLRLLCPNCHSQTDTFCRGDKKKDLPKCNYCDNKVKDRRSKTCLACYLKQEFRITTWPTDEELVNLLNNNTYIEVSKILNISESSIRNRVYKKKLNKLIKRCKK
jgi:hypothetical protein